VSSLSFDNTEIGAGEMGNSPSPDWELVGEKLSCCDELLWWLERREGGDGREEGGEDGGRRQRGRERKSGGRVDGQLLRLFCRGSAEKMNVCDLSL